MRKTPSAFSADISESSTRAYAFPPMFPPVPPTNWVNNNNNNTRGQIQRQTNEPHVSTPPVKCKKCGNMTLPDAVLCQSCLMLDPLYGCFDSLNDEIDDICPPYPTQPTNPTNLDNSPETPDDDDFELDTIVFAHPIVRQTNESESGVSNDVFHTCISNCTDFLFGNLQLGTPNKATKLVMYILNNCIDPAGDVYTVDLQHQLLMYYVDAGMVKLSEDICDLFVYGIHPGNDVPGYFSSCLRVYRGELIGISSVFREQLRTHPDVPTVCKLIQRIYQLDDDIIRHWLMVYWYDLGVVDKACFSEALLTFIKAHEPNPIRCDSIINTWVNTGLLPETDD